MAHSDALPDSFRAFRLRADGAGGEVTQIGPQDCSPGEVVIRTEYSSVNYKDALAGTGSAPIARTLPLVGGIDAAGRVVASDAAAFSPGDAVLVTGCGLSETRAGGYAEFVRAAAGDVIAIPPGLDPRSAMTLGTAGFTAGLALMRLQANGLTPESGPIVVTGASGGVGQIAIDLLAGRGFEVVAVTGKADMAEALQALGAHRVLGRAELTTKGRPLERGAWGGAIDNVGGPLLAELLRTTRAWGSIASVGLAGGQQLDTTVMPFIIRGVSLLGITSANCPRPRRETVWNRLASDWRPRHLAAILSEEVGLDGLHDVFQRMLAGETQGRTLVRIASSG